MEYDASTFTLENANEKVRKEAIAALQSLPTPGSRRGALKLPVVTAREIIGKYQENAKKKKLLENEQSKKANNIIRESVKPRVVALIKERVDGVREQISKWTPDYIQQYIAATPADVSVSSRFSETWRWHYPERRTQEQIEQAMWGAHVGLAEKLRTREDIIAKELYDELLKPELEKLNEEIRKKMVTGGRRTRRLSRNKRKSTRRSKSRRT